MLAHSRQQGMNPTNPRWPSVFVGVIAVTLFLALLCASPCLAGKNAGGALIVHTQDAYTFSAGTVCTTTYGTPASCEEANTRSDKDVGTVVWLLAAFPDTSDPGVSGIYFGIDYHDSLYVDRWKLCAPAGSIELPDSGWPGTGTGNSIAFGTPIGGNRLFPFYAFKIDGGTEGSYFSTAANPTGGYAAFIDDAFPPNADIVTAFGMVRWYADGENRCPVAVLDDSDPTPPGGGEAAEPLGACCGAEGMGCASLTSDDCARRGGQFWGPGTSCSSVNCQDAPWQDDPPVAGAAPRIPDSEANPEQFWRLNFEIVDADTGHHIFGAQAFAFIESAETDEDIPFLADGPRGGLILGRFFAVAGICRTPPIPKVVGSRPVRIVVVATSYMPEVVDADQLDASGGSGSVMVSLRPRELR